jgi:Na+-translocating ferredoxin:NAD+ oxidoreductase RnfE subunit
MAKKFELQTKTEVEAKFLDKTNLQWYNKAGTNRVTFCGSFDEIVEGKGETFEFKEKLLSPKAVTKEDKDIEKENMFLFVLTDGRFILTKRWNELK